MKMLSRKISESTTPPKFVKNMLICIRLLTFFAIVYSSANLEVKHKPPPASNVMLRSFAWLTCGWIVYSTYQHTFKRRLSLAVSFIDGFVAVFLGAGLILFESLAGLGCRDIVDDEVEDEEDVGGGRIDGEGIECYVVSRTWVFGGVTVGLLLVNALVVAVGVRLGSKRNVNEVVIGSEEEGVAVVEVREDGAAGAREEQEVGERRSKFVEKV
ncbi:hypothetical protein RUND412_011255 [Rhizina undulata]